MSTISRIGLMKQDGTIESVYCHWDGYYDYNGKVLVQYYESEDKIKKLLKLGDLSSLGRTPEADPNGWIWNISHNIELCITYNSRGEDTKSKISKTIEDYFYLTDDCFGKFCYLFKDSNWYDVVKEDGEIKLLLVKDQLEQ